MAASEVLTVPEVAQVMGLSEGLIYQAIREGGLPHRRIGRRIIVPRAALHRWLLSAGEESTEESA